MIKVTRLHHTPRKHGRSWEGAAPASDTVARMLVPRQSLFFLDLRRLGLICADVARFAQNQLRFVPNRADSTRIGPYRPYRIVSAGDRYGQNRPETAEIGLETRRNNRNSDLKCVFCLLLSLFCESRHGNVFFKNILIVKIFLIIF